MITLIIGTIFGAAISWFITRYYYLKSNHDQNHLFDKIPDEIRKILLEDQREKFSVRELNELIRAKTIDIAKKGFDAYKACPKCGSINIKKGKTRIAEPDEEFHNGIVELNIKCVDCGWEETDYEHADS